MDFADSAVYQNHDIFGNNVKALQIVLYYDDCDLCNSAGSSDKTQNSIPLFHLGKFTT